VIDLGHVRLRFVEAGEDFVFARDAVITDVPESGGRRGMLVALLAAIVVLVAGAAVYWIRISDKHTNVAPSGSPSGSVTPPAAQGGSDEAPPATGDQTAAAAPGATG